MCRGNRDLREKNGGDKRQVAITDSLVRALQAWNCHLQPFPYLMEASTNAPLDAPFPYAQQTFESVSGLNAIDRSLFEATGQWQYTTVAVDEMERRWGTRDFAKAANNAAEALTDARPSPEVDQLLASSFVFETVGLGLDSHLDSTAKKVEAFDNFLAATSSKVRNRGLMVIGRLFFDRRLEGLLKSILAILTLTHLHGAAEPSTST